MVQSNAKIARSKALRQVYEDSAWEMADKLFSLYPVTTANGERVPKSIYRCICFSGCDEDECIRRLYKWVGNQDAVAGKDAEDIKDAEQSDLSTDASTDLSTEEEATEMLDFNALD